MKKIMLVAMMAVFTSTAFAQLMTGKSAAFAKEESKNWSYIYVQYNPGVFSPKEGDSQSYNGLSMGYNMNFRLTPSIPLFLETGIGVQWTTCSETETHKTYTEDYTLNMISAKIPVGVGYAFDIPNTPISIIPNAGFDFRINAFGEAKYEYSGTVSGYGKYSGSSTVNVFDKDDMDGSENTWNRFQMGGHIGVNARFWKKLLVGVSYQFDFSEIAEKCHMNQGNITVGYCF